MSFAAALAAPAELTREAKRTASPSLIADNDKAIYEAIVLFQQPETGVQAKEKILKTHWKPLCRLIGSERIATELIPCVRRKSHFQKS